MPQFATTEGRAEPSLAVLEPRPLQRAPYAADPARSRGRRIDEPPSRTRTAFQRDRDRIIHSTAFRRLAHKTQVFVPLEDDHFRTRLTHTIEVSQIARALARALWLDEDLAETLALAHDLGHPPFGHTGEDALNACMQPWGGFDHNAHALRIVATLERRYAGFDGLNLTWESLEGLAKHNGPLRDATGSPTARYHAAGIPAAIAEQDAAWPLGLDSWASAEAQVAAIADDIAYDAHDIDDGLRAALFALEDLREVPFLDELMAEVSARHPSLAGIRMIHEVGRRLITRFVEDVIVESGQRIAEAGVRDVDDIRRAGRPMIAFSASMAAADAAIKGFLYPRMYRHPRVMQDRMVADGIVRRLFEHLMVRPGDMGEGRVAAAAVATTGRARAVADFIAGMTDRYAVKMFQRTFGETVELG